MGVRCIKQHPSADVELTVIIEVTVFSMTALHSLRDAGVAVPALVVGDDLHLDLLEC